MVVTIASRFGGAGCGAATATADVCRKVRRVSMLASPVGRFLRRHVMDSKVWRVVALLSQKQTFDAGGSEARGEEGPFHGVAGLAGQEHLLHVIHRSEEQ